MLVFGSPGGDNASTLSHLVNCELRLQGEGVERARVGGGGLLRRRKKGGRAVKAEREGARDAARCAASHWLANAPCEELNQELRRSPETPPPLLPPTTRTTRLVFGFPFAVRPAVHLSPFVIRRRVSGGVGVVERRGASLRNRGRRQVLKLTLGGNFSPWVGSRSSGGATPTLSSSCMRKR